MVEPRRSARVERPDYQADQPGVRAQPHRVPSFWRLFGLYRRQARPIMYDQGYDDLETDILSAYESLPRGIASSADRVRRYRIFEEMDHFGLVSAILDVYGEEATQPDYDRKRRVWIESKANHMIEAGDAFFVNCQIEDTVFPITRRTCKYGDAFQRMLYSSGKGVLGWRYAKQDFVDRIEDKFGRLVGFTEQNQSFRKTLHANGHDVSFPWDYVHFRLLGKHEEDGYGTSLCEGMFREWRQLALAEDAMLMYRLRRAPDRNLVLVDAGTLEDHEAMRYVNAFRKRFRKSQYIDPSTPDYRTQYDPLTPMEDIFLPVRQDSNTRIETLSGSGNIGEVFDVEHFRDAFFGAASAPKAYFGFEGDVNAKATLQQQDVRFARKLKRVQQATVYGLRQGLDIHYTLLRAASPDADRKFDFQQSANQYVVQMSPISYLDEFERIELVQMRYTLVQTMGQLAAQLQIDARVWQAYVLLNFAKLPEEMVLRLLQQTSEKPIAGAGEGFEQMNGAQREQILDNDGRARKGFFTLSETEKEWIGRAVHSSPGLRKSIATFAELAEEERGAAAMQQTDPSILPVIIPGGTLLNDTSYTDADARIAMLNEDLHVLRNPSLLAERTIEVSHSRRASLSQQVVSRATPIMEAAK